MAASSVGRCPHCTEGHLAKARDVGASEEEIAEALAVLWVIGSGVQIVWNKDAWRLWRVRVHTRLHEGHMETG